MSSILDPGKKARQAQAESLKKQQQQEELRLAEEESEVARRKATVETGKAGRSLLVATSPTGVKTKTLGG